jgi:hypothetical protein
VILFGIGIAIDTAIGSSNVRHSFRPRQRLRCRCRMRHTGVSYLIALGTQERLSLPGSHGQWVYFALKRPPPEREFGCEAHCAALQSPAVEPHP